MDQTTTYTYFGIESNGELGRYGLEGYEDGIFDPDEISKWLGIRPIHCWKKGDLRKSGRPYLFSSWGAEKSTAGRLDVEAQCMETIQNLKNKVPELRRIKERYNVKYVLMVVPEIYGVEAPQMRFNEEIIRFCDQTGTIINFDTYVNPDDRLSHVLKRRMENFLLKRQSGRRGRRLSESDSCRVDFVACRDAVYGVRRERGGSDSIAVRGSASG